MQFCRLGLVSVKQDRKGDRSLCAGDVDGFYVGSSGRAREQ